VKDPQIFLNQLGVELNCVVSDERAAVIDEAHRRNINWEVYFVSGEEAATAFDSDPLQYCGQVTDPVSNTRFRPGEDSPRTVYQDRVYYFETAVNLEQFNEMPEGLANPAHKMIPKTAE